jgi:hypothetical protein
MIDALNLWAAKKGYRVAVGPGTVFDDVRRGILGRMERKELDAEFIRRFDDDETAAMLADGDGRNEAPRPAIRGKLERLGLQWYEPVMGRNLSALIARKG